MSGGKTDTEVVIGGKVFTLSGYESEEYLQKVASYINNKISEYNKIDSFNKLPLDTQNVLLQLNIADDYFKAKQQISLLDEELKAQNEALHNAKQDLVAAQMRLANSQKTVKDLEQENSKKMLALETEVAELKKKH